MNKKANSKSKNEEQIKMIQTAFRIGGFLFPETIDEVKEFERLYGTTDIIVPADLEDLSFLYSKSDKPSTSRSSEIVSENFAMAAREGSSSLPDEIEQKIIDDIKKLESKKKRTKKK